MTGQQARQLFKNRVGLRGWEPFRKHPTGPTIDNTMITFVGWNVFALDTDIPSDGMHVFQQLKHAEDQLQVEPDLSPFRVWRLTRDHLESIHAGVKLRDCILVRERFKDSLESGVCSIEQFLDESLTANISVAEAHRDLQRLLTRNREFPCSSQSAAKRLATYESSLHRAIIAPLLQRVDNDPDPVRKLHHLQVAELAQFLTTTNPFSEQARRAAAGLADGSEPALNVEDIDKRVAQTKQFLTLARGLF
jgi:hypothetical protein